MARDRKQVRAILELMEQGLTNEEVGERLGLHSVTVARSGVRRDMELVRGIFDMLDKGYTLQEIGDHFDLTKQRVSQIVGVDEDRGSRGKKVNVDADPETWDAFMETLRSIGLSVEARPGVVDSRAVSEFMGMVVNGSIEVKMATVKKRKATAAA